MITKFDIWLFRKRFAEFTERLFEDVGDVICGLIVFGSLISTCLGLLYFMYLDSGGQPFIEDVWLYIKNIF